MKIPRFGRGCLAAVISIAVGLVAAGCGSGSDSSSGSASSATGGAATAANAAQTAGAGKQVRVAFFGYANANIYTDWGYKGAKAAASAANAKVTFFDGKFSPAVQTTQLHDAVQSGNYDALFVWANDAASLESGIARAAAAGMPVVVGDYTLGTTTQGTTLQQVNKAVTSSVGYGLEEQASAVVDDIKAACAQKVGPGKPCTVGAMPGSNLPFDTYRLNYFKTAFKDTPVHVFGMPIGQYLESAAATSTKTFVAAHPYVDVIWAAADQMVVGASQALTSAGLHPGKDVVLIGFGATKEAVAGIKDGTWLGSVGLYPYTVAKLGVATAIAAARGQKVTPVQDVYRLPGVQLNVTKESLAKDPSYAPDWSATGS